MSAVLNLVSGSNKVFYSYQEVKELLPADRKAAITGNAAANSEVAQRLFCWLATQAGHFLDSGCRDVLAAIIARTYGFHKRAELISKRHFLEGVWDAGGKSTCAPAVTNARALYRALDVLVSLGFIAKYRVKVNGSDVYSLIYVQFHEILRHEMTKKEHDMLRQPRQKRVKDVSDSDSSERFHLAKPRAGGVVSIDTSPVVSIDTTEDYNKEDYNKTGCSKSRNENTGVIRIRRTRTVPVAIDCKTKVQNIVDAVHARSTESRKRKAARAAGCALPPLASLVAMWRTAIIEKYGFSITAALTGKEYGIFKRIAGKHDVGGDWQSMITWSVTNWERINKEYADLQAYKRKQGDWSLKAEKGRLLVSDRPDLYQFVMCFPKLIKRYAASMMGDVAVSTSSEEVEALKEKLAEARKEVARANAQVTRALSAPISAPRAEPRKTSREIATVDPAKDTFFDDFDTDLPPWE